MANVPEGSETARLHLMVDGMLHGAGRIYY